MAPQNHLLYLYWSRCNVLVIGTSYGWSNSVSRGLWRKEGIWLGTVMVNFTHQLDWATRCPENWLNIHMDVCSTVFLDKINIWIGRLGKADGPPQCGWTRGLKKWRKEEFAPLPDCLWMGTSVSCLWTQTGAYTLLGLQFDDWRSREFSASINPRAKSL